MIPKVIHYCWFGGNPLPKSAQKCIASWRKYLPDYEIKEWNESNFDVNIIPYTAEAYKAKKYAFVSDYARFWILYKYGGLYFDTDVEVIKNMDDIIAKGPFMGCENEAKPGATPAQLGVAPGLGLYGEILNWYNTHHFITWTGVIEKNVVDITTEILNKNGIEILDDGILRSSGILIYPKEYFCPKDYITGEMNITDKTKSIHHYSATWLEKKYGLKAKLYKRFKFIKIRLSSSF